MLEVVWGDDRRSWGILAGRFRRRIDRHLPRQGLQLRSPVHEAFRVRRMRSQAHLMPVASTWSARP